MQIETSREKEKDVYLSEMLQFHQEQLKGQGEVRDRWFKYYLTIIGAPFPILGILLQIDYVKKTILGIPFSIAAVPFFLFTLGMLFFMMNTRQRINTLRIYFGQIVPIKRKLAGDTIPEFKEFKSEPFGADFYVGMVHIIVNSFWFSAGTYLSSFKLLQEWRWVSVICGFLLSLLAQIMIRHLVIDFHKKKDGLTN